MPLKSQSYGVGGYSQSLPIYLITNGAASYVGVSNYIQGYGSRQRNWSTTANWKFIVASNGWLPTRGYSDNTTKMKAVYQEKTEYRLKTNPKSGYDIYGRAGALSESNLSHPGHDLDLLSDAKFKCLAKARNMRVNLAVTFAEGGKTVNMITDSVKKLGGAYSAFRRGRFSQAAQALGINKPKSSLANNWLAYQYGWLPLVSDAAGIAGTIRDHYGPGRDDIFTVRTVAEQVRTGSFTLAGHTVTGNACLVTFTDVFRVRAGLRLRITSRGDKFAAGVGLSLGDVLNTAWELVPFSFVFDWFVGVGQYLESISALSGLTVLDGWTSQESSRTGASLPSLGQGSLYTSNAQPCLITRRLYTRTPWMGDAPTWPRLNGFDTLSCKRLITSAALFAQQFRGDPKIGKFRPRSSE